jgi:hypothetical protein
LALRNVATTFEFGIDEIDMLIALAGLTMSAKAAEPTGTLTLACEGTREASRPNAKLLSEQTSMGSSSTSPPVQLRVPS